MSSTEAHPTLTARLLWAHAADMMRGLPQQLSRLRHHRLTSVVFLVVDALLLALITHGYLYTTQPDLLAFYGPTWDPDVQNRLFWWLVPIYIALGLAVRAFVWLWRHRSRAGSASQQ